MKKKEKRSSFIPKETCVITAVPTKPGFCRHPTKRPEVRKISKRQRCGGGGKTRKGNSVTKTIKREVGPGKDQWKKDEPKKGGITKK